MRSVHESVRALGHCKRAQDQADSNWHLPQLVWQTVAPDKCRGFVQIVETPLAGRLWEATPDSMKWRLHPKVIRELEEPPPLEEEEGPQEEAVPETASFQPCWQGTSWQGGSSSSTSAWRPSDWGQGWQGGTWWHG